MRHKHDTNNMDHFRWEPATQVTSVGQRKAIDKRMRMISGSEDDFAMIRQEVMESPCPKSTGEAAGDANTLNTLLYGHANTRS